MTHKNQKFKDTLENIRQFLKSRILINHHFRGQNQNASSFVCKNKTQFLFACVFFLFDLFEINKI